VLTLQQQGVAVVEVHAATAVLQGTNTKMLP
jgi:predicted nuclease with RNAse H fold